MFIDWWLFLFGTQVANHQIDGLIVGSKEQLKRKLHILKLSFIGTTPCSHEATIIEVAAFIIVSQV